jgi:predicted metal-dependent hydrolase
MEDIKAIAKQQALIYTQKLGITHSFTRLSVRETTSRWGSCSSRGHISICWRLIFAPRIILDYVIAHEVSHLIEMNHSERFWHIVSRLIPNHTTHRSWLKKNAKTLWKYGE